MSNKKIVAMFLIFLMAVSVIGCGMSKEQKAKKYLESVGPIWKDIADTGKKWEKLREEGMRGEVSDSKFFSVVRNEIIIETRTAQEKMEAIKVDKDLTTIHELGIKTMGKQVQGFSELLAAMTIGDYSKITSANQLLDETRALERQYLRDLEEYAGKPLDKL